MMFKTRYFLRIPVLCLLLVSPVVWAGQGEYMSQQEFLNQNFQSATAALETKVVWFDPALREKLKQELKYLPSSVRMRYWEVNGQRAYIVEEIGRDKPITMGFIVQNNTIIKFEVLVFRESRGFEIRYPAFTQQLNHMGLEAEGEQLVLNKSIDNITGATLSVNAVRKMARFVLYIDAYLSGASSQ